MNWWIDPDTLRLCGPNRPMLGGEWAKQVWPPCPWCGAPVYVEPVNVAQLGEPFPRYVAGRWRCLSCEDTPNRPAQLHRDDPRVI